MVQRVQKYLALGYTLQTWLDDDFLYTYFLWINIPSNAGLGVSWQLHCHIRQWPVITDMPTHTCRLQSDSTRLRISSLVRMLPQV